jgi:hypothetical protein
MKSVPDDFIRPQKERGQQPDAFRRFSRGARFPARRALRIGAAIPPSVLLRADRVIE